MQTGKTNSEKKNSDSETIARTQAIPPYSWLKAGAWANG